MREATFQASILCGNLQEKTRMDIAQGPFCVEIYRKNAARPRPHLDLHGPLFTLTVRTPSVWPHCLGKKKHSLQPGIDISSLALRLCSCKPSGTNLTMPWEKSRPVSEPRLRGYGKSPVSWENSSFRLGHGLYVAMQQSLPGSNSSRIG